MVKKRKSAKGSSRSRRRSPQDAGEDCWQANADVIYRRLGDEVILVQLKTDRVYALNGTGARFWDLLGPKRPLSKIEAKLSKEFAVDGTTLRRGLRRLVAMLHSRRLIDKAANER